MQENELRSILSYNIKRYRSWGGLSQLELANKLSISTNFLSDIERCKAWISPLTLVKLAEALHIEPYELLKKEETVTDADKHTLAKYADDVGVAVRRALEGVHESYFG
jgi:transcriptional regulator with XRE-family HTH domain